MKKDEIFENLTNTIKRQFPEVAARMDSHGSDMTSSQMEEFSAITTEAIVGKDKDKAKEYLNYMSEKIKYANATEREFIDACYVEVLLFDVSDKVKKYGWKLIPSNLKELYVGFWGKQKFK